MRRVIAALSVVLVAMSPGCSRNKPPSAWFDTAGYHVRSDKVYYLPGFPGSAREIDGADARSFDMAESCPTTPHVSSSSPTPRVLVHR